MEARAQPHPPTEVAATGRRALALRRKAGVRISAAPSSPSLVLAPKPEREARALRTTAFMFSAVDGSLSGCHGCSSRVERVVVTARRSTSCALGTTGRGQRTTGSSPGRAPRRTTGRSEPEVDILPPIPIGAAESGSTRQPSVLVRLRRSRSLHDWASAHRYSAYRCYSEVVRSDRVVPCRGGRLLTRRCTKLAEGASGRVLAHRRLASAGRQVALRREAVAQLLPPVSAVLNWLARFSRWERRAACFRPLRR